MLNCIFRSKAMKDDIARITTRVGEAELTKKKLQKDIHRVSVITDNLTQEEQEINEAIRILTSEKARLKEATVTIQNEMGGLLGEISSLQIALHEQIESNEKRIEEIAQRNVVLASELREENRSLLSHVEEYHTKSLDAQAAAQEESKQTQQLVKKAKAQLAAAKRVYTDLDKQIKALNLSKIAVERDIEELSETLSYTAKTVAQQVSRQENENARLEDEGREYQGKLNASRMEEQLLLQELAQLKDELAALELAGNTSIQRSHTPNTRPAVHAEVQVSDKAHTAVIDPADTHIGGTQGFGRFVNKVLQSPGIQSTNGKAQNESSDMKFDYSSSGSDLIVPISSSFTQIDPETVMIPTSNQSSQIPISTSLSKVDIEINEVSTRIKNRLAGSSSL